jgi:D-aspartate ligase
MNRGAKPPAVVLGGVGGALSVARSLSRYGVRVHVLGDGPSLVGASRHCAEFVDLGDDDGLQERWLERLADGPHGAVVLPVGDDGLELVARHRSWLDERGYIPVEANDEVLLAMLDKYRTYELATRARVAAPPTTLIFSPSDAATAAEEVGFPCALKPLHSHRFSRHFNVKVFVAEEREELAGIVARTSALGLEMLATAIVPGGDERYCSYYTYIDDRGEPIFHFTKRKIRQYPIHFGLGTYHLTDWSPEVAAEGLRFCQEIGLRGLANVEFKRDPRDESLQLIECNHRFTAVNEIVRLAGIDLAVLTYDRLLGRPVPRMQRYRTGVRLWSQLEDLSAAKAYRRAGEVSYRAWLGSLLHRQHSYFFEWRDPGPTLLSFARKLRRRVGRVAGGRPVARLLKTRS